MISFLTSTEPTPVRLALSANCSNPTTAMRQLATTAHCNMLFLFCFILSVGAQAPAMITTTSCRTWPLAPYAPATQVLIKPTTPAPSLTSICATTTRAAQVSLIVEPGAWANVFDHWGGCNQSIEFNFYEGWKEYEFGVTWYDNPGASCTGTPTASMRVS
jgi:hypothetical protein